MSSSAHLVLVPWFLKWEDPGLAFDVALHLGTLMALLAYYWREWAEMALSVLKLNRNYRAWRRVLILVIVASIPGAIVGVLLEKQAETVFRSPILIAAAMASLGIVLWVADRTASQNRDWMRINFRDAIIIGICQAFAIVPGVSRSGATITAARALGIQREDAANFSFLMATPIIAGAGLVKAKDLINAEGMHAQLALGFIAAAIVGWIAIAALLRFVRTRSYEAFALYRIVLAALVVAIFISRG